MRKKYYAVFAVCISPLILSLLFSDAIIIASPNHPVEFTPRLLSQHERPQTVHVSISPASQYNQSASGVMLSENKMTQRLSTRLIGSSILVIMFLLPLFIIFLIWRFIWPRRRFRAGFLLWPIWFLAPCFGAASAVVVAFVFFGMCYLLNKTWLFYPKALNSNIVQDNSVQQKEIQQATERRTIICPKCDGRIDIDIEKNNNRFNCPYCNSDIEYNNYEYKRR